MNKLDPYLLGYRQAEQERLEQQSHQLAHESEWLFEQIGVREGWRVVEIGFQDALDKFYGGKHDAMTLERL